MINVCLKRRLIIELVEYGTRHQKILVTDRFESPGKKWNDFVLATGKGEKSSKHLVSKVVLTFKTAVRLRNDSQGYAIQQYMQLTSDKFDKYVGRDAWL